MAVDEQVETVEEPKLFTSVTPSGIEVGYSPAPRRFYQVRDINIADSLRTPLTEWQECPSVTTILGCLEKPGLSYWGNKIGADGVLELVRRGRLEWVDGV